MMVLRLSCFYSQDGLEKPLIYLCSGVFLKTWIQIIEKGYLLVWKLKKQGYKNIKKLALVMDKKRVWVKEGS